MGIKEGKNDNMEAQNQQIGIGENGNEVFQKTFTLNRQVVQGRMEIKWFAVIFMVIRILHLLVFSHLSCRLFLVM